jgi:hypothetical protein
MITFKSDAAGDVMMFDKVAQHMMEVMGKDITTRGVITIEQMPDCIGRLKAAIAEDRAKARGPVPQADDEDPNGGRLGAAAPVSLAQRAAPLVEQLERSLAAEKPVLWGV